MSALQELPFTRLTTVELRGLSSQTVSLMTPFVETHPYIARQVGVINLALDEITLIDTVPSGSELTEEITLTDGSIDSTLPLCRDTLEAQSKMGKFFAKKAEASAILLALFEKRDRTLYHGGYVAQGEQLKTLFLELFSEEHAEARQVSGLSAIFDTLKTDFDQLNVLLEARLNDGKAPSTLKEQKATLRYRLNSLFTHIDTNCVDKVEGFETIDQPLNEMITTAVAQIRARATRKENSNN